MSTFHKDLQALRDKYPTHYIEAWTPDDYVSVLEDGSTPPPGQSWDEFNEAVAEALYDGFDANYGTYWERIEQITEKIYEEAKP